MRNQLASGLAAAALVGLTLGAPLATGAHAAGTNAADDAIRSDLRSLASEMEAWLSRPSIYPDFDSIGYDGRRVVTFATWPREVGALHTRSHAYKRRPSEDHQEQQERIKILHTRHPFG